MSISKNYFLVVCLAVLLSVAACQPSQLAPAQTVPVTMTPSQTTVVMPTNTPTSVPTETPTLVPSPTPWDTPTPGPTPLGGSEHLFFGLVVRSGEGYQPAGVYQFNPAASDKIEIFGQGYGLQDVSPDGRWLLVNQGSSLYTANRFGGDLKLVSDNFFDYGTHSAGWTEDMQLLLWIEETDNGNSMMFWSAGEQGPTLAPDMLQDNPVEIYLSPESSQILFASGSCSAYLICDRSISLASLENGSITPLSEGVRPALNQVSGFIAARVSQEENSKILITDLQNNAVAQLDLGYDVPVDYQWSPSGEELMIMSQVRSDYSGKNFGNRLIRLYTGQWNPFLLNEVNGLNGLLAWSPDGRHFAVTSTNLVDDNYQISFSIINRSSAQVTEVTDQIDLSSTDYLFIDRLEWAP